MNRHEITEHLIRETPGHVDGKGLRIDRDDLVVMLGKAIDAGGSLALAQAADDTLRVPGRLVTQGGRAWLRGIADALARKAGIQ